MPVPKKKWKPGDPDPDLAKIKDPYKRVVARQLIRLNTHLWELRSSLGIMASWAALQEQEFDRARREREGGRE